MPQAEDLPDTQAVGTVHLGRLSVQSLKRKQVLIPRKSKNVKSLQNGPMVIGLDNSLKINSNKLLHKLLELAFYTNLGTP